MEDYFKQAERKKKKNAFKKCSMSDCEHLKCNLGQNQEGCTFRPVNEKMEKAKKVARVIDNIPIIGTGGANMQGIMMNMLIIMVGFMFITGKELILQTPDCEDCEPQSITLGKNALIGWACVVIGTWSLTAPKNAKLWLSAKWDKLMSPFRNYIINKVKRKKEELPYEEKKPF